MFKFRKRSLDQLATCHEDLQAILKESLNRSYVDFGVSEGYRSLDRQLDLYREGKTKVDGISEKSKHNTKPSLAADIFIYVRSNKQLAYDYNHLCYVAGVIQSTAIELFNKGIIKHKIRWGGNWDSDGIIINDQSFQDLPHFELI